MFVHRCTRCGHIQQWHALGECSYGWCPCDVNTAQLGPPEPISTFDDTGREDPRVLVPGSALAAGFHACACDQCAAAAGEHPGSTVSRA